jgi:hypothetical protein
MTARRGGLMRLRAVARMPLALLAACAALLLVPAYAAASRFEAGAAGADITPPAYTAASDAAFVPVCGATPAQVAELYPGPRPFQFEKPYVDQKKLGRYAFGDPYCESDGTHRYEAPYIAGGSGVGHWPIAVDPQNGPAARAVVVSVGSSRVALVSVDSIGLFNSTMERIRAAVQAQDPTLTQIFISSTHDESAPDPIGLWGPELEEQPSGTPELPIGASSGVDEYYFDFLVERIANAVVAADHARKPAKLHVAIGSMPSNTQSCWSSYPFIDDQAMPVMQALGRGGRVVFTLVDVSTHAETLAFSGNHTYINTLSADWPGKMRAALEARWPGSVGMEIAGLVGSVETPTVYEPESTQVLRVPGPLHGVSGNPDGCRSVYPNPSSGTPVSDAKEFNTDYGNTVANAAALALQGAHAATPKTIAAQQLPLCLELENNLFKAAFADGLFPDRPAYSDPNCTVAAAPPGPANASAARPAAAPASAPSEAMFLKSAVGVVTLGKVQLAYSPGEVFPVTEVRGPFDEAQEPFPTECYEPSTENFNCGAPLPITPWTSAEMTQPYRFLVGLGEDMIGYLFPPGNFVGSEGESSKQPWLNYEDTKMTGHDRFGYGHSDDSESVGPYAGLTVTEGLKQLLHHDGQGSPVAPGLFVDSSGHLADSPFAAGSFTGAVGIEAKLPGQSTPVKLLIGRGARSWATFDGLRDPGTAGTSLPYSVRTAGVILHGRKSLLIDVFAGARALGLH